MTMTNSPLVINGTKMNGSSSIFSSASVEQKPTNNGGITTDALKLTLTNVNPRDLVPLLVARHVLRSDEMRAIYAKKDETQMLDELVLLLQKKKFWLGPLVNSLILNGRSTAAEKLMQVVSGGTTTK